MDLVPIYRTPRFNILFPTIQILSFENSAAHGQSRLESGSWWSVDRCAVDKCTYEPGARITLHIFFLFYAWNLGGFSIDRARVFDLGFDLTIIKKKMKLRSGSKIDGNVGGGGRGGSSKEEISPNPEVWIFLFFFPISMNYICYTRLLTIVDVLIRWCFNWFHV